MPSDRISAEDFEQLGAAFSRVYLMALNGVVCDPTDPCKLCAPFWKQGKAILDRYDPGWGNMGKPFALSAAATARPDPCNQCGRAQDEFENIESRAHRWEGIARELYEAGKPFRPSPASIQIPTTGTEAALERRLDEALTAYERASLGEGEGGR